MDENYCAHCGTALDEVRIRPGFDMAVAEMRRKHDELKVLIDAMDTRITDVAGMPSYSLAKRVDELERLMMLVRGALQQQGVMKKPGDAILVRVTRGPAPTVKKKKK